MTCVRFSYIVLPCVNNWQLVLASVRMHALRIRKRPTARFSTREAHGATEQRVCVVRGCCACPSMIHTALPCSYSLSCPFKSFAKSFQRVSPQIRLFHKKMVGGPWSGPSPFLITFLYNLFDLSIETLQKRGRRDQGPNSIPNSIPNPIQHISLFERENKGRYPCPETPYALLPSPQQALELLKTRLDRQRRTLSPRSSTRPLLSQSLNPRALVTQCPAASQSPRMG